MVHAVDCRKDLRLEIPGIGNVLRVGFRVSSVSGLQFLGIHPVSGGSKCCSAEAEVNQLTQDILVNSVFPYGLVVLGCASLQKVNRELPLCGLPVSCSTGKHLNAELGIVCRLLLGLGPVTSAPQGLHRLLPLSQCLLAPHGMRCCHRL